MGWLLGHRFLVIVTKEKYRPHLSHRNGGYPLGCRAL
jgi:hypothetical protein